MGHGPFCFLGFFFLLPVPKPHTRTHTQTPTTHMLHKFRTNIPNSGLCEGRVQGLWLPSLVIVQLGCNCFLRKCASVLMIRATHACTHSHTHMDIQYSAFMQIAAGISYNTSAATCTHTHTVLLWMYYMPWENTILIFIKLTGMPPVVVFDMSVARCGSSVSSV